MADAGDLKSPGAKAPCGFESRPRHPSEDVMKSIGYGYIREARRKMVKAAEGQIVRGLCGSAKNEKIPRGKIGHQSHRGEKSTEWTKQRPTAY